MRSSSARQAGFVCLSCATVTTRSTQPLATRLVAISTLQRNSTLTWKQTSRRFNSTVAASASDDKVAAAARKTSAAAPAAIPNMDPLQIASVAEKTRSDLLSAEGIPSKKETLEALGACLHAAASLHPQLKRAVVQSKVSASRLASLGAERTGTQLPIDARITDAISRISHAAYTIIASPNVEMTPEVLEVYVQTQAQLGRPESLPSVLSLYATKPKPVLKNGKIEYVATNPNAASRAIEVPVADMALQTAIETKSLDSALGIIEASYCVPAFKRQKLIKHGTAPAIGLATLPFGILGLSTAYAAYWQNTMDLSTATAIGFTGISGYFLVVGSLGVIAKFSNKDQMKRVTWMPGTPLRYRWMREEERKALDKVACAWGFKEPWRHGEEMGADWEGLREYMGYRQMLLDRVEFMEGMG